MDKLVHLPDASPHAVNSTTLVPQESGDAPQSLGEESYDLDEPPPGALESSVFTFITGVLMSGSLMAAIGALIKAIARGMS